MAEWGLSPRKLVERSRLWALRFVTRRPAAGHQHIPSYVTREEALKAVEPEE